MTVRKKYTISIIAGLALLAMIITTVVGLMMTDVRTPAAQERLAQSHRETTWDHGNWSKSFSGDAAVWKVFGKQYTKKDNDLNYWIYGGLLNIVPGGMQSYYSGKSSASQYYYDPSSNMGIAQMYITDMNGSEHRVYCFDFFTAFANTTGTFSSYSSLAEAGIPTDVISETEIMNMAKAIAALQENNWALLKEHASEIAIGDFTWSDVGEFDLGHDVHWTRAESGITHFANGDAIQTTNTITKAEVVAMLQASSTTGNNAREFLLQWMIWDNLNRWYINSSNTPPKKTNAAFASYGGSKESGGKGTSDTSLVRCPCFTWDHIINFKKMFEIGLEHYEETVQKWEKQYDFKPDQMIEVTGDEAANLIATYDAAGSGKGLYDPSIIDRFEIDRHANKVTMHASATVASAYDSNWCAWLTCGDGMIFSTSGGIYNGNGSKGEGTVSPGPGSSNNNGAQFTVDASAICFRRVRFTVAPADGYVTVHKSVPDGYSANGAEYGVYSAQTCQEGERIGTLTIGPDGNATTPVLVKLNGAPSKTVYVKETKVPASSSSEWHWVKDEKVYDATITLSHTQASPFRVESHDEVVRNYGHVTIHKDVPTGRSAAGAEYSVYTSSDCSSGYLGKMTIGADGNATAPFRVELDEGKPKTVYVKETQAPTETSDDWHWNVDTKIYEANVTVDNTEDNPIRLTSSDTTTPNYGYITIHKDVPASHSAKGAEYGVYSSGNCYERDLIGTMVIGDDGNATELFKVKLTDGAPRQVWVKETKTPTEYSPDWHWKIDETIYPANVTVANSTANPVRLGSADEVIPNYGYLTIHKIVPVGHRPDGAQYGVYSSARCDAGSLLDTVTIQSNGDCDHLVEILLKDGNPTTVYVKETKVPTENDEHWHWLIDTTVYDAEVTMNNTKELPVRVVSEDLIKPNYGYIQVQKSVYHSDTGLSAPYSPAGAVYGIYSDEGCTHELGRVTIGPDGTSEKFEVVWGYEEDGKDVWVKEISVPPLPDPNTEWHIDENVYKRRVVAHSSSIDPEDAPVQVAVSSEPITEYGHLRVRKMTNTAYSEIVKENSLYGVANCEFVIRAITGDWKGRTIGHFYTNGDGWIDLQRVPVGIYEVEEVTPPAGHKLGVINTYQLEVRHENTAETPVVMVFSNRPAADPFVIDFDKEWGDGN